MTNDQRPTTNDQQPSTLDEYCAWVSEAGLDAPWSRFEAPAPSNASRVQPFHWHWADIEPRLRASPQFAVPGNRGEPRLLGLANPGVPERTSSHTLSAAVQYLLPGETSLAHRHTPNALRFMLGGRGAYTSVDGHKCVMSPGDLVLAPSMAWHEHGNEGTEPVIWLEGLDAPIVRYLDILKMEPGEESAAANRAARRMPRTLHYKWDDAHDRLLRQAETAASPFDDVIVEYHDPVNGESVLPTIGCYLQMIRAGVETRAHCQTSTAIYHVVRGSGTTAIGEARYNWNAGDFFVVPPHFPHAHAQRGGEPAILFSMQDVPLLDALGLYVESPVAAS